MKGILIISILLLFGCSSNIENIVSFNPINKEKVFTTYEPYYLLVEPDSAFYNSNIKLVGNGKLEANQNTLRIIAFDTTKISIELYSKSDNGLIAKKEFSAIPNNNFNEDWKNLEPGETPTPLTESQVRVLGYFMKYRLLNKPAPNFYSKTAKGDSISEDVLKGKITLVNFWYYGCVPCIAEIPALNRISNHYSSDTNIQFLSFFMDSIFVRANELYCQSRVLSTDTLLMKPQKIDLNFTHIPNSNSIKNDFYVSGFPTNMVIDRNGIIREIFVGANPDNENKLLESNIKKAIENLKTTANKGYNSAWVLSY